MAANVTAALAGVTNIPFLSQNASSSTYWYSALAILASLLVYEQINYRRRKQHLPGPSWTIPIMGRFLDSRFPSLEKYIEGWKQGPLSVVSVFHIFIVMTSTTEFSRKVFNSAAFTSPSLVASARTVLEPDNWVFIHGKAHVEYRKILNTLFTRKALAMYLTMQDRVVRQHLAMWLNEFTLRGKSDTLMHKVRDINLHISLKVFCGPHIPDHAIAAIGARYWEISTALQLVNIPFAIPGTAVWRAIQSRKEAMKWLTGAAEKSLAAVDGGAEPECMLDAWVVEIRAAQASGKLNRDFTPREMGLVLLSFLFASQDAMSSGIVWLFQHMANHPEISARIRAEQDRIRGGDADAPVSLEMVDEMTYLRSCIKESLRVRPPVPMVPYWADKDFPISEDYTVPKGAMVIASVWPSCMDPEVYPEPEKFDPERWSDPNSSANQNPNKYLVFGSGPHRCIGVEYTMIHMCIVAGTAAMIADWTHHPTPESEKTVLLPTIFPKDGCIVTMRHRQY